MGSINVVNAAGSDARTLMNAMKMNAAVVHAESPLPEFSLVKVGQFAVTFEQEVICRVNEAMIAAVQTGARKSWSREICAQHYVRIEKVFT